MKSPPLTPAIQKHIQSRLIQALENIIKGFVPHTIGQVGPVYFVRSFRQVVRVRHNDLQKILREVFSDWPLYQEK